MNVAIIIIFVLCQSFHHIFPFLCKPHCHFLYAKSQVVDCCALKSDSAILVDNRSRVDSKGFLSIFPFVYFIFRSSRL